MHLLAVKRNQEDPNKGTYRKTNVIYFHWYLYPTTTKSSIAGYQEQFMHCNKCNIQKRLTEEPDRYLYHSSFCLFLTTTWFSSNRVTAVLVSYYLSGFLRCKIDGRVHLIVTHWWISRNTSTGSFADGWDNNLLYSLVTSLDTTTLTITLSRH